MRERKAVYLTEPRDDCGWGRQIVYLISLLITTETRIFRSVDGFNGARNFLNLSPVRILHK
jgi:hypothetical protein